jgi:folate-dependent phosphoribosylglycinamide formyltransferase PurN
MRLIICTKRDYPGCYFLNRLLPHLAGHDVRVWLSNKTRPTERSVPELAEIAFVERTLLTEQLFPLIDRLPNGASADAELATFEGLKKRYGIPIDIVDDVRSASAIAHLESLAPDLMISSRFSHIFKRNAIDVPRCGIVNLHPGALPHFAGLFAPMRTVNEGYGELTGTLHWIDEGIDTGPILALRSRPLKRDTGLLLQVVEIYCDLIDPLLDMVRAIESGHCPEGIRQDTNTREYRSLPSEADLTSFHATGMDFWKPAELQQWIARFLPPDLRANPI